MQRGPGPWSKPMNVLELVRKQADKKSAREEAQKAVLKAQSSVLVYRGVPYQTTK